ncbi:hypothetical protein [Dyadobacter bucti]|uniref:hypothetical protein n=1 Tax=Dyadobacter bucti TaxID=2572203 RepID=UPI001109E0EE|nr:hypothetical protein [Dyadobacter bucti]
MKEKTKNSSGHTTRDGYAYLTKRLLVSKAQQAGKAAAKEAMELMGYVVTVKDGWVVKLYPDNTITLRVEKNGHDVPVDKIESRYYRSLQLARKASEIA